MKPIALPQDRSLHEARRFAEELQARGEEVETIVDGDAMELQVWRLTPTRHLALARSIA